MTVYEGHPIPLTPDAWPDRYLGIDPHAHPKVSLEAGLGDLYGWCLRNLKGARPGDFRGSWGSIDVSCCFSDDAIVGIYILHRIEVGVTFEQMCALPACVLGADLLTVDTLDRKTLHVDDELKSNPNLMRHTLSSSFARNSTNAACTSLSDVRPIMLLLSTG